MGAKETLQFLNETFNGVYAENDSIKRVTGIIQSVVPDTNYGKAVVQIGNKSITLINKSKEFLAEGDHVWVHYWNSLADGYIALRCGEPNNLGGFYIESAGVVAENISSVYTVAGDVINVDTLNKLKSHYGNAQSVFILDEATAICCNPNIQGSYLSFAGDMYYFNTPGSAELKAYVNAMNHSLWSNKIKTYWTPPGSQLFVLGQEYTYYVGVSSLSNINGEWCYYLGVFCEEVPTWYKETTVYFKDPAILGDSGLILICKSLGLSQGTLNSGTTYAGYGGATATLGLCCGSASSGYIYDTSQSPATTVRTGGLLYVCGFSATSFKDEAEYNYAVALTQEQEIISSRH